MFWGSLYFILHFCDLYVFIVLMLFLPYDVYLSFYIFANSFNISHFYLPFSRAWELLTGCLLFLSTNIYTRQFIGKKIIFYSLIFFSLLFLYFVFLNNEFNEKYFILLSIFLTIFYILF